MKTLITLCIVLSSLTAIGQSKRQMKAGNELIKAKRLANAGYVVAGCGTMIMLSATDDNIQQVAVLGGVLFLTSFGLHIAAWQHIGKSGAYLSVNPGRVTVGLKF